VAISKPRSGFRRQRWAHWPGCWWLGESANVAA
jgi:hypothetical protein